MAAPVILLRASTYSGSGTWNDESGNGKNATLSAGTIAKNAKGNGIVLNGSTSWTFPNVALGNAWSVNVWYKNIGSFSQYSGILTQLIASGPFRSNLLIGNTGASGTGSQISVNHFNKNTGGGDWNIGTNITSDLLTGNWINIQATWDGSSIKTYINGNIVGTVTTNGVSIDNGNAYYIGTSYNGVAPFVTGEIGEVRLYNYAITGAKVVADYNASSPTYPRLMVLLSAVNYSGTGSWLDSSVNGNNATLETGTVAKNIAGNGIVLNGSTSWTFPNVALGNSYTVNVWYKNTNISAWGNILTQIGEAPNNNFSMGSLTGNSDGKIAIGYPSRAMSDYFSLTTGAWTNIQATWNGTTLYVYINSVLTQTKTPGVTLIDGGNAYRIGWCWNQSVPKITGEIGEVRMYNFALTQEEVSADYISSYKSYFWQPTRIGGLQLWLDANDQSSFAMNGSRVSQWSDKSGSANNMTQVTSAYQPSLSINNGMNFVNTETGAYMRNTNITFGPQYSIFAIGKTNNAIDGKFHYLLSTGTSGGLFMLSSVDNNFTTNVGGQSSWNSLGANTPLTSVTSLSLMEMLNGGTSTTLLSYVNGTALNPKNGTTLATTGIFIGWNNGNQFWDGLIGEVLVYNGLLSSLQREVVEGYLSWKWGLQASLPSSHSFYSLPPIYNEYITVPPIFLLRASSYSGSGAWLDESGNGRDATLETGVIAKNTRGDGSVLNGSTSWTFPDIGSLSNWTLSVWFKQTEAPDTLASIVTQIDSTLSPNPKLISNPSDT